LAIWTGLKHSATVLKAATAWQETCIQKEGSMFSHRPLWTKQNISQLKTLFVDHPLLDDRPFYEKLHAQIANAAPEISQLAAEAIWILLLFVYEKYYGVETKRERVSEVWGFSNEILPESPHLSDDCLRGFANPGTSFLTRIWLEFGFLLTVVDAWKSLSSSEQLSLLQENPWGLCQWVTNIQGGDVRSFRHMFLYFCYPNSFERICSRNNKKQIYAAFASKLDADRDAYNTDPSPCGLDKSIFEIRKVLQAENNTDELDFYLAPLVAQWRKSNDNASLDGRTPEIAELRKSRSRFKVPDDEPPARFNAADGTWNERPGVGERIREKLELEINAYEDAVDFNLGRAQAIADYRFPIVDIRKTAVTRDDPITDADIAEIFVRINNQGTRLGQADFVLTLLSVFHGELRDRIEERARAMSHGTVITIDTQQLLRAVCGVAFGRARMSAIYSYLRGVDPTTGEADPAERRKRLDRLDDAAKECMETTPWRDYLLRVQHAGFVSQALVASKNAIVNGFAFYILGRKAGVSKSKLDEIIARWVFGSLLTARYSGSSETIFEQDLARVPKLESDDSDVFIRALDNAMGETLTGDYWTQSLVSALETEKGRTPAALAFRAAQIVLGTRALFSDQFLRNLLDPPADGMRAASEAHHLFPTAWLHANGVRDRRLVNQVANLADVGWHENSVISGQGPAYYVPRVRQKLEIDDDRWGRMCAEHALPLGWESMDYAEFLRERQRRMADIIRVAFRQLGGEADSPPLTPPWFLPGADTVWQRIAETERALRNVLREVYAERFSGAAAKRIEDALPERERESLARSLRARPAGSEPLSIVDYLYLSQIPPLLFAPESQQTARQRLGGAPDVKQRLLSAVNQIAPVRNEIAHVREVGHDRLLRASVACADVLEMLRGKT
jgi:hypothetical protein